MVKNSGFQPQLRGPQILGSIENEARDESRINWMAAVIHVATVAHAASHVNDCGHVNYGYHPTHFEPTCPMF